MMINNMRRNLNSNMLRMEEYFQQLSTGKKINLPSDDPAGLVKALRLRTSLKEGEQYLDNIGEAVNYLETTDGALMQINEVVLRIRELTVKAATGTNSSDSVAAIAQEIYELNDQLKMIANTTYGSKYIFAGTNVTEEPYQNGKWTGNNEILNIEITAGVTVAVNITSIKEFLTGRLQDLFVKPGASFLKEIKASSLQEGAYKVSTKIGNAVTSSKATEVQNYLSALANNGEFFYVNSTTPAALGIGTAVGQSDSHYSGSLMIEAKKIGLAGGNSNLKADLGAGSTATSATLTFEKELYFRDQVTGELTKATDADLSGRFIYQDSSGNSKTIDSAMYTSSDKKIAFTLPADAVAGDTITLNNNYNGAGKGKAYDQQGNEYTPVKMVFDGTSWVYDDAAPTATLSDPGTAIDDDIPTAELYGISTSTTFSLSFDETMYSSSDGTENGTMTTLTEGQNITSRFTYTGSGSLTSAIYHVGGAVDFIVAGAADGDKVVLNDGTDSLFNFAGKKYVPAATTYDNSSSEWVYPDNNPSFDFDKALYFSDGTKIPSMDMTSSLTLRHADGTVDNEAIESATYYASTNGISFSVDENKLQVGDTIILDNIGVGTGKVYNQSGVEYVPVKATWDGTTWNYDEDSDKVIVDIKGHIYRDDGSYQYVDMENVELNMTAASGEALFTIPASKLFEPPQDPAWEDLVIWNNGAALGGINGTNPQLAVGDKTVIGFSAQEKVGSQKVNLGYTYTDIDGNEVGKGSQNFVFDTNTLNNKVSDLKFFTLNEGIGVDYSGGISLKIETLTELDSAASFDYQAGLLDYVSDLGRKVELGKLPEVGNELAGADIRINELLSYRSTVGARVNRLELQQSRLESTQISYTSLLAQNEDADEAEVIMNLKMQENVYQSALAAGARIIQPTLMDFLH
jgi:flagellar hook-associated protein 3